MLGDSLLASGGVGADGCERVAVFDAATGFQRGELGAADGSRFGGAIAVDGDTIAITAANTCTIHLFDPAGHERYAATGALRWRRGGPSGSRDFGIGVAADRRSLAVGFWRDNRGDERVALLDPKTGRLQRSYRLPRGRSEFGAAVAIRGNRILVGAMDAGQGRARAYLFARRSGRRLATYRAVASSAVALGHHIVAIGGAGSVSVFAAPVE